MTVSEHPDVALPEAMIEAAARGLHDVVCPVRDCTATVIAGIYGTLARAALSAALGVCRVEEQRSIQGEDDEGPWTVFVATVDWPLRQPGKRYTRLEITTPWTPAEPVDTEGAAT